MEVAGKFLLQRLWKNDEDELLGIRKDRFEENPFPLDDLYSALLKVSSVASINCGEVSCSPFILSQLNMDEDRRGIGVGLISFRSVE